MKEKLFGTPKRKAGMIVICALMVLSLGVTSAFAASAATQDAKMVKDGEVFESAIKVKEGLPAGRQFRDGEEAIVKNIAGDSKAPNGPIKVKEGAVPAGAIKVKDGAPAGQQFKDGEVPAGQPLLKRNSSADQQIMR